jgi:uncharacterized membrane protein
MTEEKDPFNIFVTMSGSGRRLKRWHSEGLVDVAQVSKILEYEKNSRGKRMIRGVFGIALFAIALGILSIIAANWVYIPGSVKLGAHFTLNAAIAASLYKYKDKKVWAEGLLVMFLMLNLTLIVLIGQVYQLSGNYAIALSVWMAISTPAVLVYSKQAVSAVFWTVSLIATLVSIYYELQKSYLGELSEFYLYMGTAMYLPLMFIVCGSLRYVRQAKPHISNVMVREGVVALVALASLSTVFWYTDLAYNLGRLFSQSDSYAFSYSMMLLLCLLAPVSIYCYEWIIKKQNSAIEDRTFYIFLLGSVFSIMLPFIVMPDDIGVLSAVHFVVYWVFLGWVGYKLGFDQLLSLSISLITIRLIIVYFELFGGLLLTGFGLIFSGILILVLLKIALKVNTSIKGVRYG